MSDNVHALEYKNVSLPQDVVDKIIWIIEPLVSLSPASLLLHVEQRIGNVFSVIPFIPIVRRGGNEIIIMDQSTYCTVGSRRSLPNGLLPLKCDTSLEVTFLNYFGYERTIKFSLIKEINFVVDRPDSIIRDAGKYFPGCYQNDISSLRIGSRDRRFSTLSELGVNLF